LPPGLTTLREAWQALWAHLESPGIAGTRTPDPLTARAAPERGPRVRRSASELFPVKVLSGALNDADEGLKHAALFDVPETQIRALSTRVRLLVEHDRADQALAVLNEAIEHGGRDVKPVALICKAGLYTDRNDTVAAIAAYELAAASGHLRYAPQALYNLGVLRQEAGDLSDARNLYEQVLSAGTHPIVPFAANNLCAVCVALGELDAAEAALRPALDSDNTEQAGKAWANLGSLRGRRNDRDGARDAWHQAAVIDLNVVPLVRRMRDHLEATPDSQPTP
jgi:tetratricopeptide (TPR) repeat protein